MIFRSSRVLSRVALWPTAIICGRSAVQCIIYSTNHRPAAQVEAGSSAGLEGREFDEVNRAEVEIEVVSS